MIVGIIKFNNSLFYFWRLFGEIANFTDLFM